MACLFGHKWDGCKCEKCGKVRDEQHDWDLCNGVCKRCGAKQAEQHDWDGCKCKHCGKTRDEQHNWSGYKCTRCAKCLSLEYLETLSDKQPTWFSPNGQCNNNIGVGMSDDEIIAKCDYLIKTDNEGNLVDESWNPCKCPSCGFAIHLDMQPDFTCRVCNSKVSTLEAICTINAIGENVKYDRSFLQKVITLSSHLPTALAASVETGRIMDIHAANYYFNNNTATRALFGKLIGMDYLTYVRTDTRTLAEQDKKLKAADIERLYTTIMQNCIQVWSNEKPEKNYFA